MKNVIFLIVAVFFLAACSNMKSVPDRKTYAQPSWYQKCAESGTEGWFWRSRDMVYVCGSGESRYSQAAEEQMYAIAMNNFAKRINSNVNSYTTIEFDNDRRTTRTKISYEVNDTRIREHLQHQSGRFTLGGKHYTFVRLKMPRDVFDQLLEEARYGS